MSTFFPNLNKQTSFDEKMNARLLNTLRLRRKVMREPNTLRWLEQWRFLREEDKIHQERIETVLSWYCENMGNSGVPVAYSASAFRFKFSAIEQAMSRCQTKKDNAPPPAEEKKTFPQEVHAICKLLKPLPWSKSAKESLPESVDITLHNYKNFRKTLFAINRNVDCRLQFFITEIVSVLGPPHFFTEQWYREVCVRLSFIKDWRGDLLSKSMTVNGAEFQGKLRNISMRYSGSIQLQRMLMEIYLENGKS